jgi:hypothetical protein
MLTLASLTDNLFSLMLTTLFGRPSIFDVAFELSSGLVMSWPRTPHNYKIGMGTS